MTVRRLALLLSATLVAGFALLHLAGARAYVGLLSGTLQAGGVELVVGVAYVLAWFAVVVFVPISTLAVLLDVTCGTLMKRRIWQHFRGH